MTYSTDPSSFVQTYSVRIGQRSLLPINRVIASGGGHTSLIPSLAFACRMSESVQHGGYLIIAMAHGHSTNDLERLYRRCAFSRRTRPLHRQLCMRTTLPMNRELQGLFLQIRAHDDLFHYGAEDHFLECGRAVLVLPDLGEVLAHHQNLGFF